MSKPLPVLRSLEEFLFGVPLYVRYQIADTAVFEHFYGRKRTPVDGHCPYCQKPSTFNIEHTHVPGGDPWAKITERVAFDALRITCVREKVHVIRFEYLISKSTVEKFGQYPSLATVSNDEVSRFRKILNHDDAQEFHKAIGLAAHGVGVGSFVYLRRVFENLIYGRYKEFKTAEGWNDEYFYRLAMADKIKMLHDHLPAFLVENAKIYSILSIGIHELQEEQCLAYFDVLKHSIIIILEEDERKRDELNRRKQFSDAIAKFNPSQSES